MLADGQEAARAPDKLGSFGGAHAQFVAARPDRTQFAAKPARGTRVFAGGTSRPRRGLRLFSTGGGPLGIGFVGLRVSEGKL